MITDERKSEFEQAIRRDIPRELLIEVMEQFPVAARQADAAVRQAHKAVDNGLVLSRVRESKTIGLVRHHLIDQAFEQIVAHHGGREVKSVPVETGPEEVKVSPIHLTTGEFGATLVGFASHREAVDTPIKNATRRALCHQNRGLSSDLFHREEMFRDRQRFVLIMVRRDARLVGKIASITVCVLDSRCETYLYQEDIEEFLSGYGSVKSSTKIVPRLKSVSKSFKESRGTTEGRSKKTE